MGLGVFSYQWHRDGADIPTATNATYLLIQEDVRSAISVRVVYTDGIGILENLTSPSTTAVLNVNDAPTGSPVVTGTALQGQELTANTAGISDVDGLGSFHYVWQRDGEVITGANAASYTLAADDVGTQVRVVVRYTDDGGTSEEVTSGPTGSVQPWALDLVGTAADNTLDGDAGNDTLDGLDGNDLLRGFSGDDTLIGGTSTADLRDLIYGGDGDDVIDGGYGNGELRGDAGDDILTGSAFSDLLFGGDGLDFVNGGFGHDRVNGGAGADRFFHIGVRDHGSDWIQDYSADEGDTLLFGIGTATGADFRVTFGHTENAAGERSGDNAIEEVYVIYSPTGQVMWALVDGAGQAEINIVIGGVSYDLLA